MMEFTDNNCTKKFIGQKSVNISWHFVKSYVNAKTFEKFAEVDDGAAQRFKNTLASTGGDAEKKKDKVINLEDVFKRLIHRFVVSRFQERDDSHTNTVWGSNRFIIILRSWEPFLLPRRLQLLVHFADSDVSMHHHAIPC